MALIRIDNVPIFDSDLSDDLKRWLSFLPDQINANLDELETFQNSLINEQTADVGGSGATIVIAYPTMTAASAVSATVISSTNPCAVRSATPAAGTLTIVLTADPGASCFLSLVGRLL